MNSIIVCANPLVVVIDDLFDKSFADKLIDSSRRLQFRAKVGAGSKRFVSEARTNTTAHVDQFENQYASKACEIASSVVRLPVSNAEVVQVLNYQGTQNFGAHLDAFRVRTPEGQESMSTGGQRIFTTLLYLNTPEMGGETVFPNMNISVRPKLGRLLLFANTLPGSNFPHPQSTHIGTSVKSGEKWVASIWWRQNAFRYTLHDDNRPVDTLYI